MKKYANIDIAKFIMAIFVVIIHTLPFFSVKNNLILNINEAIIRCAVPFFFMASGFLIFDKGNDGLKSHIKKLIKIYLILTLMYLPLTIYGYVSSGTPFISACKNFVLQFFCRGENYFSWPLWYILSSIYAFIAIFIMKKMKLKDWHILSISFLVFIFAHTMTYFTANVASLYETPIYIYIYIFMRIFWSGRLFTGLFYIALGMYIKKCNVKISIKYILPVLLIMFVLAVMYPNNFTYVPLHIVVFLLIINIKINLKDDISLYFRKGSTIIYYTHMYYYFIYSYFKHRIPTYGFYSFTFTLLCCLLTTLMVVKIKNKRKNVHK